MYVCVYVGHHHNKFRRMKSELVGLIFPRVYYDVTNR